VNFLCLVKVIALELVKFLQISICVLRSSKVFTLVMQLNRNVGQDLVVVHLGFGLWIYAVFLELLSRAIPYQIDTSRGCQRGDLPTSVPGFEGGR
jgi:hypothetical protein